MNKKGQAVSLFLIVGVILLISFGVFLYLRTAINKQPSEISTNFESQKVQLKSQIDYCIEAETKEAVFLYGVSKESSNDGIKQYLEENLEDCIDFKDFEEKGLDINKEDVKVNVNAGETYLGIDVDYSLTVSKETSSSKMEEFNYNMEIKKDKGLITKSGFVLEDSVIELKDAGVKLEIPKGTLMLDLSNVEKGKDIPRIDKLNIEVKGSDLIENSEGVVVGKEVFDLKADDAWFYPDIKLTIEYDNYLLPKGVNENNIKIIYYEKYLSTWVELETKIDKNNNLLSAEIHHFTAYSIGIPGELKEELPSDGIGMFTGAVIGIDSITGRATEEEEETEEDLGLEEYNCEDYSGGNGECLDQLCNAYTAAYPSERCFKFESTEMSDQQCPDDTTLVSWSCPGDHHFRCCVRNALIEKRTEVIGGIEFEIEENDDDEIGYLINYEVNDETDYNTLVMLSERISNILKKMIDGTFDGELNTDEYRVQLWQKGAEVNYKLSQTIYENEKDENTEETEEETVEEEEEPEEECSGTKDGYEYKCVGSKVSCEETYNGVRIYSITCKGDKVCCMVNGKEIQKCIDTDKENDITKKGKVEITTNGVVVETKEDECIYGVEKDSVKEYYCEGSIYKSQEKECPDNEPYCEDGICLSLEKKKESTIPSVGFDEHKECIDSDGASSISTFYKGKTKAYSDGKSFRDKEDYCIDNNKNVIEYYCVEPTYIGCGIKYKKVECSNGCSNGRCLRASEVS